MFPKTSIAASRIALRFYAPQGLSSASPSYTAAAACYGIFVRQKLVVSLLTKEQEFQALQAADAQRAAARAGLDVEIVYARNNGRLQVEQLYHFVHAAGDVRPVAIIAQAVAGDGLARVASDAVKAGIGWVLLNRDLPYVGALRAECPRLPIAAVTTDQREIGRIQGRQLRGLLPDGGHVLYVEGPADSTAAQQRLGVVSHLRGGTAPERVVLAPRPWPP